MFSKKSKKKRKKQLPFEGSAVKTVDEVDAVILGWWANGANAVNG